LQVLQQVNMSWQCATSGTSLSAEQWFVAAAPTNLLPGLEAIHLIAQTIYVQPSSAMWLCQMHQHK
jgi:hypothetical protein